jgi:hypothetical protein
MIIVADLKDTNDPDGRSYREINNATAHNFNIGQLVELDNGVRMFIAKQTRDCDGTPLYCLTAEENQEYAQANHYSWVHGYSEDGMNAILSPKSSR